MSSLNRLRGLRALLEDVVEHGTTAVERVHKATAARPFDILDLTPVAPVARGVREIHDATVAGVYETIRQVNHLVGATLSAAIDLYDAEVGAKGEQEPPAEGPSVPLSEVASSASEVASPKESDLASSKEEGESSG
jgi:hypothetical protein